MSGSKKRAIALVLGMSGGLALSSTAVAALGTWYVGAGGGISLLSPDTTGSAFTLEEEQSQAGGVYLGLDINDWLSAEAAYTLLGEAQLSNQQTIGYTAASIGGIAYVYKNRGMDARQEGMSGYVRLGMNSITNESEILLNEADNTAVWIGAGIQYPIGRRLGLRAEVASFDGDAQVAMASVYWRSKDDRYNSGRQIAAAPSESAPPLDEFQDEGIGEVQEFEGYEEDGGFMEEDFDSDFMDGEDDFGTEMMVDGDFGLAASAECNNPAIGEPTDSAGCALFSGVLQGVEFQPGSATLTSDSEYLLESLAMSLNNHPNLVVELQLFTEDFPEPGRAMQLSRERALVVAGFLTGQSVDVQRLRARAFGSSQPKYDSGTEDGRRLNNRLELKVL